MLLKYALLIGMILNAGTNMALEYGDDYGDPEILKAIRDNVNFADLDHEKQEFYASQVNMKDKYGNTPLWVAIEYDRPISVFNWLITNGADVDGRVYGDTPLYRATINKRFRTDIIDLLLEHHADCTLINYDEETPLQCAKEQLEFIKYRDYEWSIESIDRAQAIVNKLEVAEREQCAWNAKKTWIAGVASHC